MTDVKRTESEKRRRRTCADRLRHHLAERQRQRRGNDPAGKALLHLLGLLSGALALLPPLPVFFLASGRPQRAAGPVSSPEVPPRSDRRMNLDRFDSEERGPTCYAMEHEIEPVFYRVSSRVLYLSMT